eukprot:240659-Amphidinium_carterae.2
MLRLPSSSTSSDHGYENGVYPESSSCRIVIADGQTPRHCHAVLQPHRWIPCTVPCPPFLCLPRVVAFVVLPIMYPSLHKLAALLLKRSVEKKALRCKAHLPSWRTSGISESTLAQEATVLFGKRWLKEAQLVAE